MQPLDIHQHLPHLIYLLLVSILLLLLLQPLPSQSAPATDTLPPTGDQCLTDGYFCFEVLRGPRYSYRIRQDDERVMFSMFAKRLTKEGEYGSHSWNISLLEGIDIGEASLVFLQADVVNPALKLVISKEDETPPQLKLYEWSKETWTLIAKNRRPEFIRGGAIVKDAHGIQFVTTEKVDQLTGLEGKNLTIGFAMTTEQVDGKADTEDIDFTTHDGHFFFKDKPEIREYREKRKLARQKEKAANTTIIIVVLSIVALLIVIGVVIGFCYVARSQQDRKNRRDGAGSRILWWKKGGKSDQKDPDHCPPAEEQSPEGEEGDKI